MLEATSELCYIFQKRSSIRHDSSIVLLPNNEQVLINPNRVRKLDNKSCDGLRLRVKADSKENLKKL